MASDNFKPEVFISYAWGEEGSDRESIVDALQESMKSKGLEIVRDKTGGIDYKGSIEGFMKKIGEGHFVLVIISDKYLKSRHCMFELLEVEKKGNFKQRIFPIVLPDAKIHEVIDIFDYTDYWQDKINQLQNRISQLTNNAHLSRGYKELDLFHNIRASFDRLMAIIADMNTLNPELLEASGFEEIYLAIQEKMVEDQRKKPQIDVHTKEVVESPFQNISNNRKHFCNRSAQRAEFIDYLTELSSQKFHFYIIHGEERQSHGGLVNRFALNRLGVEPERIKKIVLEEATSEMGYRNTIKVKLFERFLGGKMNQYHPGDLSIKLLAELVKDEISEQSNQKCVICFKVHTTYWKDFTPKLLNWFATEFCEEKLLPENSPVFYFFLNVVYPETAVQRSFWEKIKLRKERKVQISEQFRLLRKSKPLEELKLVKKQEVLDWFEEHVSVNDTVCRKLYDYYFKEQQVFFMEEVEEKLEKFINDYNDKIKPEHLSEMGLKF